MPPLAQVRSLKGYTAHQLAKAVGMSESAIADIERGATKRPRPSTIARISAFLAVDPATITEFVHGNRDASNQDTST